MGNTPEVLYGVQWTGDNLAEIGRFVGVPCTAAASVLRVPVASATDAGAALSVSLRGWLVRVDGELRALLPRTTAASESTDNATSPDVERIADHLAFEDGFD